MNRTNNTTDMEAPFTFDGHGVNDATGRRLAKISVEKYLEDGRTPNPEHEALGRMIASGSQVKARHLSLLRQALTVRECALGMANSLETLHGDDMLAQYSQESDSVEQAMEFHRKDDPGCEYCREIDRCRALIKDMNAA